MIYNIFIISYLDYILHGIVSNEMAFNLLCGEILPSSAHVVQS